MKAESVVAWLFIGALATFWFASPFLIAWAIWSLIAPVAVLERLFTMIVVLIVCGAEGTVAWFLGLVLIKGASKRL